MSLYLAKKHPINKGRLCWLLPLEPIHAGGTVPDLLGHYPGTVSGAAWDWSPRPGRFTVGHKFTNAADAITINNIGQALSGLNAFSVSLWLYETGTGGGSNGRALGTDTGNVLELYTSGSTTSIRPMINGTNSNTVTATILNVWSHIVYTWIAGAVPILYQNGTALSGSTSVAGPLNTFANAIIGNTGNANRNWAGDLADVSYWTRALTAGEAAWLYNDARTGYRQTLQRRPRPLRVGFSGTTSTGSGSITLAALSVSGTGSFTAPGTGAITLGPLTVAGAASFTASASGSVTLGALAAAGAASFTASASGAITLGVLIVSGAGTASGAGTWIPWDTFTDSAGTDLASHTPDSGGTWSQHPSYSGHPIVVTDANRIRQNSAGNNCLYIHSATPPSADYEVSCEVRFFSTGNEAIGPVGRCNPTADTWYNARYRSTAPGFQLVKSVAGTATQLGSTYGRTLSAGETCRLSVRMIGTTISLWVDGVQQISVTDSAISAAGQAGMFAYSSAGSTNSTEQHADNFNITPGSGSVSLGSLTVAGTGTFTAPASGAVTLGALSVAGAGSFTATATGAIALASLTAAGTGSFAATATGSIALAALTVAGGGTASSVGSSTGTGSVTLAGLGVSGSGVFTASASGAIALGSIVVAGAGTASGSGPGPLVLLRQLTSVLIAAANLDPFSIAPGLTVLITTGNVDPFGIDPDRSTLL